MGFLKYVCVPLLKLFVTKTTGFERIPRKGPVILVANHASYIDGALIALFTDWHRDREVRSIQSREWLSKSWIRQFIFVTLLKQIPTDGAIQKAIEALRAGDALMLFPEGGRTSTGKIQRCTHTGLGVLTLSTGAPVIPIGIRGTWEFWNRHQAIPTFKRCIELRAGKPLKFMGTITKKRCLDLQTTVMKAVARLAGKEYPFR